jgi:protein TonB
MKPKKTKKADLESKRGLFFQIGLAIALGMVFLAFEYSGAVKETTLLAGAGFEEIVDFELPPVTRREEKPELPPPPVVPEEFTIVDDDIDDIIPELDFTDEIDDEVGVIPGLIVEDKPVDNTAIPFALLQNPPEFPGGMSGLMKYIGRNIKYPVIAVEQGIKGTVYVNFIVNKKGEVSDITLLRGVDSVLDKEALRVIGTLPKWKPGMQNGASVNVSYQVPIKFDLQ